MSQDNNQRAQMNKGTEEMPMDFTTLFQQFLINQHQMNQRLIQAAEQQQTTHNFLQHLDPKTVTNTGPAKNRMKTSSTYSDQGLIPMELDRTEVNKMNGPVRTNKEKKKGHLACDCLNKDQNNEISQVEKVSVKKLASDNKNNDDKRGNFWENLLKNEYQEDTYLARVTEALKRPDANEAKRLGKQLC
ncbi:2857_t:CDS:2 [Gigaspora margarita]|uniref:2857_t:CDS:1 n=1 Tax=Gigaspora margarita TaxID=4874 RepID=A0ABM8W2G4_GIGMA|nr:2857_t:CDS:2 [Gigaspora margarita]